MNWILIEAIIFLSTGCVVMYALFMGERAKNLVFQGKMNPFKRKKNFLTGGEKVLYTLLKNDEDINHYHIFPQLHLCTVLEVKDDAYDMMGKFEWLNRLYSDFFLFDKETLLPVLAIELNDSTHKWNSRHARDEFVKKALEDNGIPLVIIITDELPNKEKVIQKITNRLIKPISTTPATDVINP